MYWQASHSDGVTSVTIIGCELTYGCTRVPYRFDYSRGQLYAKLLGMLEFLETRRADYSSTEMDQKH
ncbi:hypothetical protein niasHT_016323 [Heterodera trifolii]|uniref:Uncharacterized protein n=1 Tax=Heterodera trifolii TaxID=157864 RepID=A0ABD2KZP8_9BILA